jgi:hypothetical protein
VSNPRIYDYDSLCQTVQQWINRFDSVVANAIPDMVNNAEKVINRRLRTHEMVAYVQAACTAGQTYLELPGDFLEAVRYRFIGAGQWIVVSPDAENVIDATEQQDLADQRSGLVMKGITLSHDYIEFYPPINNANTFELEYFALLPALDDINQTNWLLAKYPDVYLYGVLCESAPFLRDDDRLQTWGARFGAALQEVLDQFRKRRFSGGPLRYRPRVVA